MENDQAWRDSLKKGDLVAVEVWAGFSRHTVLKTVSRITPKRTKVTLNDGHEVGMKDLIYPSPEIVEDHHKRYYLHKLEQVLPGLKASQLRSIREQAVLFQKENQKGSVSSG